MNRREDRFERWRDLEEAFEPLQHSNDIPAQELERFYGRGSTSKRYLQADISIHVHVRLRSRGNEPESCDLCAVFVASEGPHLSNGDGASVLVRVVPRPVEVDPLNRSPRGEGRVVLVGIPEAVKDHEKVASRVVTPSVVRLNFLDYCPCLTRNAPKPSLGPFVEAFRRLFFEDGESVPPASRLRCLASFVDELPHQVLKRGPQVVDDLPDQHAESVRSVGEADAEEVLIRLGLELSDDLIGAKLEPGPGFRIERFQVFQCPLALFEAAV